VDPYLNGTYTCTYVPVLAGPYLLGITLDGVHVRDSPYAVMVTVAPTNGARCVATEIQSLVSGSLGYPPPHPARPQGSCAPTLLFFLPPPSPRASLRLLPSHPCWSSPPPTTTTTPRTSPRLVCITYPFLPPRLPAPVATSPPPPPPPPHPHPAHPALTSGGCGKPSGDIPCAHSGQLRQPSNCQ
jgi:hypothetical protein